MGAVIIVLQTCLPGTYSITATTDSYSQTKSVTLEEPNGPSCASQTLDFDFDIVAANVSRISYWAVDDSTTTLNDVENENPGTFGVGATFPTLTDVSGDYCLTFDGNDYIDLGTLDAVTGDTDISVCMLVRFNPTDMNATAQLIDCNYATDDTYKGFQLYMNYASGVRRIRFGCHQNDTFGYVSADSDIGGDEQWHFIVGVRDHGISGKFKLYTVSDTTLTSYEGDDTVAGDIIDSDGNSHYRLGAHCKENQGYFIGDIDDVAVYEKALSVAEIKTFYKNLTGKDIVD